MMTPLFRWAQETTTPWKDFYLDKNVEQQHGQQRRGSIRKAFQKRLRATPGVVASRRGSIGCSLNIRLQRNIPVPPDLARMMREVQDPGIDPRGEIIPDDITAWRTMRYLAAGFYYRWNWPDGVEDLAWLDARRDWNRWVRRELQARSEEGYDSPFLVAAKTNRELIAGRSGGIHRAWSRWQRQKVKPPPPTSPVWVDDYLIREAIAWLKAQKGHAVLWYESSAVGKALSDHGVVVYGAGAEPPRQAHNCAMSIRAHGIGKNLQAWSNQCIIEPPTGGLVWEQLLGRMHRQGQEADEVDCTVFLHVQPFARALESATTDAQYIFDASGNVQKLLFATLVA